MDRLIKTRSFHYRENEYRIEAEVLFRGQDLCIVISGGDRPHIGAAALAVVTASNNNSEKPTAAPSVITVPGHKEHHLALTAAEKLSKALERTVVVTVGIHIEDISPDLIKRVVDEFHQFVTDLAESIPPDGTHRKS